MNKLIMNYLVSGMYCGLLLYILYYLWFSIDIHILWNGLEGFKEAAEKFEQEAGITSPLKLNTLGDRIKVIESVQLGKMQEAITLINELYPGLLDDDRDLYFHLQVYILSFIKAKLY